MLQSARPVEIRFVLLSLVLLVSLSHPAPAQPRQVADAADTTDVSPAPPSPPGDTADVAVPAKADLLPFRSPTRDQTLNRAYQQDVSIYPSAPTLRYTRVEGVVVGAQRPPLTWTEAGWWTPYGQAAYATELRDVRVTGGVEARVIQPTADSPYGLKVGVQGGYTTTTEDQWKRSWSSNSVSALIYGTDLFTYYEIRQATVYAVQRLSPEVQLSLGATLQDHRPMATRTDFSVFGTGFDANTPVDAARLLGGIASLESGRLTKRSKHRSVGTTGRIYLEGGQRLQAGGPYVRAVLDGQIYSPVLPNVNVNLRGRLGVASDGAPVQYRYQLDGVRGLRTFTPPEDAQTHLALGGLQLVHYDAPIGLGLFEPVHVTGFADVGWTGSAPGTPARRGETFGFAGVGVAVWRRLVAVEWAWPLHTSTSGRPQFSLRISPLR